MLKLSSKSVLRKTRYYLVCPDKRTYWNRSFRTVRDGDEYAIKHLRGKGYCSMLGKRVISLESKGIISEQEPPHVVVK